MKKPAIALGKGLYGLTKGLEGKAAEAVVERFLGLLAARQRLNLVPAIITAYEEAKKKDEGIETVEIVTAAALSGPQADQIAKNIGKAAGASVEIEWKTDPSLIGGAVIRHRDTLLDASVKRRLELLTQQLA